MARDRSVAVPEKTFTQDELQAAVKAAVEKALADFKADVNNYVREAVQRAGETSIRESVHKSMSDACSKIAHEKLRAMDFNPIVTGIVAQNVAMSLQGIDFCGADFGTFVRRVFEQEIRKHAAERAPNLAKEVLALT